MYEHFQNKLYFIINVMDRPADYGVVKILTNLLSGNVHSYNNYII